MLITWPQQLVQQLHYWINHSTSCPEYRIRGVRLLRHLLLPLLPLDVLLRPRDQQPHSRADGPGLPRRNREAGRGASPRHRGQHHSNRRSQDGEKCLGVRREVNAFSNKVDGREGLEEAEPYPANHGDPLWRCFGDLAAFRIHNCDIRCAPPRHGSRQQLTCPFARDCGHGQPS